jgi:hypothetical protein
MKTLFIFLVTSLISAPLLAQTITIEDRLSQAISLLENTNTDHLLERDQVSFLKALKNLSGIQRELSSAPKVFEGRVTGYAYGDQAILAAVAEATSLCYKAGYTRCDLIQSSASSSGSKYVGVAIAKGFRQ